MPTNQKISYGRTLLAVTNFMNKSGISSFCQQQCQGACCHFTKTGTCDPQKQDCNNNPRLACRVWLCHSLFDILFYLAQRENKYLAKEFLAYYMYSFKPAVIKQLQDLMAKYACKYQVSACYNQPMPNDVIENFEISHLPEMEDEQVIKEIRELMDLLENQIKEKTELIYLIKTEEPLPLVVLRNYFG